MQADVQSQINEITRLLREPFWRHWEFWIPLAELMVGIGGLIYAILAFKEAGEAKDEAIKAKQAATAAGRTVKIQSVAIELTEIIQRLDSMDDEIKFTDARDLLTEVSRRLYRATAPFVEDKKLSDAVAATRGALETAHTSLTKVRPTDPTKELEAPYAVYYGIEDTFASVSKSVANLIGLFEGETFDLGDSNG